MVETSDPPFRRLGIVGLGLVGGSVALGARAAWPSMTIAGLDPSGRAAEAVRRGMVTDEVGDLTALASCDLIVLAVPMAAMAGVIGRLAEAGTRVIVTDVGSTKRQVMQAAAGLARFVGGHPMAGAERPGLEHARVDLFRGRPWLLVRGTGSEESYQRVEAFVTGLGARPRWVEADAHDRAMAFISHLPQVIATALMNAAVEGVGVEGVDAAGPAFADMTRLAASPSDIWQGILEQNADYVAEAIAAFERHLPRAADLASHDWVQSAFDRAGAARERWRRGSSDDSGPRSVK